MTAAVGDRLGAAVALLFIHGWRVSEILGLAWSDLDLERGTATVGRACVYVDGYGMVLDTPKTESAEGVHDLAPVVVELLRRRMDAQIAERLAGGDEWEVQTYDGRPIELVFTTTKGRLVLRQAVSKAVARAAKAVDLDPTGLGTHGGRSTTITTLYAEEGVDMDDIARLVGHANPATTAGYVRHLGPTPPGDRGGSYPASRPDDNRRSALAPVVAELAGH